MTQASRFRTALTAAAVLGVIAVLAIINHYAHFIEQGNAHPIFGRTLGVLLLLIAVGLGIWANYNRPTAQP